MKYSWIQNDVQFMIKEVNKCVFFSLCAALLKPMCIEI